MKRILFIVAFLSQLLLAAAQKSESYISLLTCSPGTELYSAFGHSALRLVDKEKGLDVVFNYGTFSFNEPNFYVKFAQGKLPYMLSAGKYAWFYEGYLQENRAIIEQVLNLDSAHFEILSGLLRENYEPENRFYRYDFFYDNCSSRIRDIVQKTFGDQLVFDTELKPSEPTFRDLIQPYLDNGFAWGDFGIDLGLGLPCDKQASASDYMFLPDELMLAFDKAKLNTSNGEQPLVLSTTKVLANTPIQSGFDVTGPWMVVLALLLFALFLSYREHKTSRTTVGFDVVYFSLLGLVGVLVLLLWFATDHTATHGNLNFLWAMPAYIFVAPFFKKKPALKGMYFRIFGLLNVILLGSFWFLPQAFHPAVLGLIAISILRSYMIAWRPLLIYK